MPSPLETYQLYLSLKNHFSKKSYDFHKYKGKVNATMESLLRRPDRFMFERLGKKYSREKLIDLFVSNFVNNPSSWIGSFVISDEAEENYIQWLSVIEKLSYHFLEECDDVFKWCEKNGVKFNTLFKITGSDHPIIIKMVVQKVVSMETFILLDNILNFCKRIDKKLDDPIWEELYLKRIKYGSFIINIDLDRLRKSLQEKISKEYPELI